MNSSNFKEVKNAARGRWRWILEALGVRPFFLSGRHTACPFCGGKDRFRFDDKDRGAFICNQCGAGDGFDIVARQCFGGSKSAALKAVAQILNTREFGLRHISVILPTVQSKIVSWSNEAR